ncbi:reverse transcriptase domain-containing protein [Tanacetum coccineum]
MEKFETPPDSPPLTVIDPDDQPMWSNTRTVAPTPSFAIIQLPLPNNFHIKGTHMQMIRDNQFDGRIWSDPHRHVADFLEISSLFQYGENHEEAVILRTFPFSLSGEAKTWLNELDEGTITSWNELREAFISRQFSPAKFKYDPTKGILNVGGIFLYNTPNEAFKILDDKVLLKIDCSVDPHINHKPKTIVSAGGSNIYSNQAILMEKFEALATKINSEFLKIRKELKEIQDGRRDNHASQIYMSDDTLISGNGEGRCLNEKSIDLTRLCYLLCSIYHIEIDRDFSCPCITTRSGVAYQGPTIPTTSSSPPKVVERETEVTKDTVPPTNNGSTKDVQPPVVQVQTQMPNSEPVVAPVSAPMPNLKPSIPYPSRRNDERRREKANDQIEKFYEIFKDLSFEISLTDALILMPKFASTLKALIGNKEKLSEMARTPLNEHCSAVILNKLPKKLGDPSKFLKPFDFSSQMLTPTCKDSLKLRSVIFYTIVIAEGCRTKVGKFQFPADFVVIDFDADPRVPLILGRSFLKTGRALIDVYKGELTL